MLKNFWRGHGYQRKGKKFITKSIYSLCTEPINPAHSVESLIPENHVVRVVNRAIDQMHPIASFLSSVFQFER